MPVIQRRIVRITIEYGTQGSGANGELLDSITAPLEAASRGLVNAPGSDVTGFKVTYAAVSLGAARE